MSSVDSRIVTMKFDNVSFERNARTSLSTLERLKQSMNFGTLGSAATKGLGVIGSIFNKFGLKNPFATAQKGVADLQQATNKFQMQGLEGGITSVSKSFLAMSTIAITALSNITTKAMAAGSQLVKSLTTDPITGGLREYETNLNSIQTILANTKVSGANLKDVNAALDELNHYSDKTIYNFSEMAKNIGTFTAAGVDLDTATGSIKGIANLAALSGSNSQQAASAMYQLSQEIAAGRVSLMGWNSVVNAGMGGSTFQRALVQTAQAMGTLEGRTVEFTGKMKNATIDGQSFRDSIMAKPGEVSWLSSKVLTNTLKQFTGDLSEAELKAQGFNDAQIKAINAQAKTAVDAATKVKTLSGVLDTAKEVVGSGWAKTWQIVFGDFKEARSLFTNVSNVVNGGLEHMAKARNKLLENWDEMGGREKVIKGIGIAFKALGDILGVIKDAFRDIFPPTTAKDLIGFTDGFVKFAKSLKIGGETAENLRRTFRGVFSIFSIIGQVISAVAGGFGKLFGAISKGSGGFLDFTGGLGDAITAFDQFLRKSGVLESFFDGLASLLSVPIALLSGFAQVLGSLFTGFNTKGIENISDAMGKFNERVAPLESAGQKISAVFEKIGSYLSSLGGKISKALGNLGDMIANAITPETFSGTLDVINTSLLGALVLMIRKFFTGGLNVDLSGGLFDGIKETLGAATGALQNMQASLKADILLKIAGALAILAASLVVLSLIDGKKLAKALGAMAIGFAGLQISLATLSSAINLIGAAKLPFITASMVALSTALLIFALALKVMASIELGDMVKSLLGMGAVLFMLSKALGAMSKNAGGTMRAAAALLILGVALNVMAVALKIFATMSWEEMGKGLAGVAGSLLILAGAMRLMPKGMLAQAAAITALGVALNAIAVAVKIFASMSWEEMARGLVSMAGALIIIAGAMKLMPKGILMQAAALVAVGVALNFIGLAMKNRGSMGWDVIVKVPITLGGALLILAVGLRLMQGTLGASAALTAAAFALGLLVPVLATLGSMKWTTIVTGLLAIAGVFAVLGIAGMLLGPLTPVILGLSAALLLIGGGLALAGAGALAFATAFGIVVAAGSAGVQVMGQMIGTIIKSIPKAMKAFGQGIVEFAKAIGRGVPAFMKAFTKILTGFLDSIIKITPKIGKTFLVLLDTILRVLVLAIPKIVNAGMQLILGLLRGIEANIGQIVKTASSIIQKFMTAMGNEIPKIVDTGAKMVIKLVNGIANAIRNNSAAMGAAAANLGTAIIQGMGNAIAGGIGIIKEKAMGVARAALDAAKDFLGIKSPSREFYKIGVFVNEGFRDGLVGGLSEVDGAMEEMKNHLQASMDEQEGLITDHKAKLKKLKAEKDRDEKAIKKSEKALAAAKDLRARTLEAQEHVKKGMKQEIKDLRGWAKQYDDLIVKIEDAEKALEDAVRTRDDFAASTTSQYNARPEIDEKTTVEGYTAALRAEQAKVDTFHDSLNRLVAMGLDDASYQRFIEEGVGVQPFLNKLLEAGPGAVAAVDAATADLGTAATRLGSTASVELYQAGVDSAQGLLNGLPSQKATIESEMDGIAKAMIKAIKKRLKIKSPSREFAEVGRFSNEGLAKGLTTYSKVAEKASSKVGANALDKMRESMSRIGDAVTGEMDVNPSIKPVLDLSSVQKDAAGMSKMFDGKTIAAGVSYGQAAGIYSDREAARAAAAAAKEAIKAQRDEEMVKIELTQINQSPVALSPVDIYRQTKNQFSLVKEALNSR